MKVNDMSIKNLIKNLGTKKFPGSNTALGKGYHSFPGFEGRSHIGSVNDRVKLITDNFDVKNKLGFDIGCSVGGISIELARQGARMIGVDYDNQSIEVAHYYANKFQLNIYFYVDTIDLITIKNVKCEFIVWFSQFQWFVKQYGPAAGRKALEEIRKKEVPLFFESSCGDGMAGRAMLEAGLNNEGLRKLLNDTFNSVKQIGTHKNWRDRPIFLCV